MVGGPSVEEPDRNNEIGGNVAERGKSASDFSTALVSSFSLTGGTRFKCDSQMEDTSSSETASDEPEFPIASRVRSTESAVAFWVAAAECSKAICASRAATRL